MDSGSLRVLHAVGWYFPESSGGTEVYVDALATQLARRGVVSSIVAAANSRPSDDYEWHGHPVHRYEVPAAVAGEIEERRPHSQFDAFEGWLQRQQLDVYHQHSWSRGCGAAHLRAAKRRGLRTVLTVHVPSVICLRGTMMLNGVTQCDGLLDQFRCTACWGTSRGIPAQAAALQAQLPRVSTALSRAVPSGPLKTALATPALVDARIADLAEIGQLADRVVAVSQWLQRALIVNGLPASKVIYSAQGVDPARIGGEPVPPRDGRRFRVGFLGRWDPVKGIHVLVEAIRSLPASVAVELRVFALPDNVSYEQSVRNLAAGDGRIHFERPLGRDEISEALRQMDVLAVPSQWLETGPLVALEAFAAGRPVLGSDLGGLRELVVPGVNGRLVPADDVQAWARAITEMTTAAPLRIPRPRTTESVADDMHAVYADVLAGQ